MPKYYKVINGCKKCTRKGIFSMNENEVGAWECPSDSSNCSGELISVSSFEKHKGKILKIGGAIGIVLVLVSLFTDGELGKIESEFETAQKKAQNFRSEVAKVPQNHGASDPYRTKWVSKINKRTSRLNSQIEPIKQNVEKLNEFVDMLKIEEKRARRLTIPDFAPPKPLKKYSELKSNGNKLLFEFQTIKRKAEKIENKGLVVKVNVSVRDLRKDLQKLKQKSKVFAPDGMVVDPEAAKLSYIDSILDVQSRTKQAISNEILRRARIAEEERLRLLAEAEEERIKSQQQRVKEWNDASPNISIKVSKPLADSLVEPLVRGFFFSQGMSCKKLTNPYGGGDVRLTSTQYSIELADGGEFAKEPVIIEVRDRATSKENSRVIALDAMVIVGGSAAPTDLIASDIEKIIAGKITNWSQLGGRNGKIDVVFPSKGSKDANVVSNDVAALAEKNSNKLLSSNVVKDCRSKQFTFGVCAFHNSIGANRLSVRASSQSPIFDPSPSSISSENYRYTKRVYVDLPVGDDGEVEKFLEYVESADGQQKVAECGFIDLRIDLMSMPLDPFALPIIANAFSVDTSDITSAYRLNTNFRFATNSSDLDTKARADIERVQQTLNIHLSSTKKALVVGFTDSSGADKDNVLLSSKRANRVFNQLVSKVRRKTSMKSAAEGEKHPIADNDSNIGKSQNRRVEIWIVEIN